MNHGAFDTVTRHAATAVTRRGSLRALGGVVLASALARPAFARAGKAGKQARKACKRQRSECEVGVRAFCGEQIPCLEAILPCCRLLAACQTTASIECLATFGQSVASNRSDAPRRKPRRTS